MSGPTGIDTLLEASCAEATHDAASSAYSPQCFPGTRKQYIEDIVNWAIPTLGDTPTPIYWMKGPAGVGKSAIAQTCAEELKDRGKLGAAFFFSISGRNQPEKFFPSIAYQLSTIHPPYRDLIDHKIRHDKTLVKKSMTFQFRYLIQEPLQELEARGKGIGQRIAVIVDGLDECEGADAQCEIVRTIASAAINNSRRLCWAFFSRPEPHIEASFAGITIAPLCYKVLLPISRDADGEIELYLRNAFEHILRRRNTSVESQWPSAEDMQILVGAADGLFIYATTVIRFVNHLGSHGPQRRLRAVIDFILDHRQQDPRIHTKANLPFAELDAFYSTLIMQRIPMELFPSVHLLLFLISQWGLLGAIVTANALGLSKEEFEAACNYASAVVLFEIPDKDPHFDPTVDTSSTYSQISREAVKTFLRPVYLELGGQVSFYHKSFGDFLLDPARSGSYCIKGSETLAMYSLKMYTHYDRTLCWEGSAPGMADSASSLSYPYTNELINSLIKTWVYVDLGNEDSRSFEALGGIGILDADRDFRKYLNISTHLRIDTSSVPSSGSIWGCRCLSKSYPGTWICWIPLSEFNINEFKSMIELRKQANVIRRHRLNWSSAIKSFFKGITRERFESALYLVGRGEKSIFCYWEIDYELGHYREFRTVNLAEGKRRFREEHFASWPEHGHEYKRKP